MNRLQGGLTRFLYEQSISHKLVICLSALLTIILCVAPLASAMSPGEARHLLARTGFGGTPEEIRDVQKLGYKEAVDKLLEYARTTPTPPAWVDEPLIPPRTRRAMDPDERKAFRRKRRERGIELAGWWYVEMIRTDSPLTERMTLFWHNHFTSSLKKVKEPQLLYRQNLLLRKYALGSFRDLLHAIAKDPAMILYLDNVNNRKRQPNENFARELLELFTMGEGHYSEQDIKEAARAFTGWSINRRDGTYRFRKKRHDNGPKAFMGKTGRFNGDDIIEITLQQPQVSVHIVNKFWREFISETPRQKTVESLAAIFRRNNYEIKPFLRALFLTKEFRASRNRGRLIKSPTDLIVGTFRLFDMPVNNGQALAFIGRKLGQSLFDPPNVKGWPGGKDWITSSTLMARQQFLERLLRGREMGPKNARKMPRMRRNAMRQMASLSTGMYERVSQFARDYSQDEIRSTLLPLEPIDLKHRDDGKRARITQLLLDPVYQLK